MNQNSNAESIEKKYNLLKKRFEEYDQINLKISRYPIFNFYYHISFRDDNLVYVEICEGAVGKPKKELNDSNLEDALIIDLNKNDEVIWAIYTVKSLIKRSQDNLLKAKELSKPSAGLMYYDDSSDKYFVNSKLESALQLNKDLQNEIYLTKVDILAIIYFLKNFVRSKKFLDEVGNLTNKEIYKKMQKITKRFDKNFKLLNRVEGMPRWEVRVSLIDNKEVKLECKEKVISADNNSDQVQVSNMLTADINNNEEMINLYNVLRNHEECNLVILDFAQRMMVRSEFPFYYQNDKTKEWWLTKLGQKVLDDFNLLDFLNFDKVNDLLAIDIN
ncbi:hypothetical protein SSABA_v1c05320 [Spiroplasma sabaudiense Ar-1343]|uniref:Uncharacterized protein n=1 Tax=Spiroplasma sabaudiense Ar-1343 TaxID=1276257 RepID=W6AJN4_9MOLU|nr:hypothetical protein [Spiroplasma sabaudiense]AHI53939.1 hypothetical protein SSABA_v1c05320 [Spiroplasma sabaudiense Ar-1343]